MLIWRSRRGLRSLFLSPLPQGGGSAPSAWYASRGKKIAKQPHELFTFWSDELLNPSVIIPSPSSMNAQVKTRPDDTRARIMDTADALFRRLGFAKTTVADIAAELGMSPANVYRFFPSKNAIVESICQSCLSELDAR